MPTARWLLGGAALALALDAVPALPASTSPGKSSAYESRQDFPLPAADATLLTATITKGRRRRVMEVVATLRSPSFFGGLVMGVRVNGVELEPGGRVIAPCDSTCFTTGVFWLDLDAAEASNPGVFVGQPLTVELIGGSAPANEGFPGTASMAVRLEKK
jgi:hypothetical protein